MKEDKVKLVRVDESRQREKNQRRRHWKKRELKLHSSMWVKRAAVAKAQKRYGRKEG